MHRLARCPAWCVTLLLLSILLLSITACAGDKPAPRPTPELEVVVFVTEAPTNRTSEANSSMSGTTVGMGDQQKGSQDISGSASDDPSSTTLFTADSPDRNPLTGLKIDDQPLIHRRPLMVRIGNDPEARPQVALDKADIVYEELVEWWLTRFTAIYLSQDPEMIAPIRSVRLINLQLTPQYQGVLASSGGSDPVRWEISQSDIIDLDEYFVPKLYFYRQNNEEDWVTRLALDAAAARDYLLSEGLESDVNLRGFVFSHKLDLSTLPTEAVGDAEEVIVPYPELTSEAKWQYDPGRGQYLRFTTGEPMETVDGDQITAANVIIYFAEHQPTEIVEDSYGSTSIRIIVNGLGTAWLLRDGKILKGNWQTDGREMPNFVFNDGQPMPLKPGKTWIEVIPLDYLIEIDGADYARLDETTLDEETESASDEVTDELTPAPTPTSIPIGASAQTPAATKVP